MSLISFKDNQSYLKDAYNLYKHQLCRNLDKNVFSSRVLTLSSSQDLMGYTIDDTLAMLANTSFSVSFQHGAKPVAHVTDVAIASRFHLDQECIINFIELMKDFCFIVNDCDVIIIESNPTIETILSNMTLYDRRCKKNTKRNVYTIHSQ